VTKVFAGQNFFISGAAKGLGRALALGLAADGATVGLADIDETALKSTAGEISAVGGYAQAHVCGFLLSESASFINGAVLCVDGGIIASA
jgi:NAD(P)-dependent dehydrogenase (short-subunit alcohol dehydrogenase family)